MAAILYGTYILISRPRYNEKHRLWLPYASISWDGEKFHYHELNDLAKTFDTEDAALAFGFVAARDWIDEHKSDGV
jgi:hypothetical protein